MKRLSDFINRSLPAQVGTLLIIYWIVHALCFSVFFQGFLGGFEKWCFAKSGSAIANILTNDPFHSWSISIRSLCNPIFLLALTALYIPYFVKRKNLPTFTRAERIFFGVCAMLISWELITYDYNYYLDSSFWFDRILLLALSIAVIRFPSIIPLFVAMAFVYRAQFNFPVAGFPLFDKRLLFDLLILGMVFQYMRMFIRDCRLNVFHYALCIVAANYFFSGIQKIITTPHGYEWLTQNDPADLFNNVVIRGWLGCSTGDTVDILRGVIMACGEWLQCIVLLLEVGVVLIFWKRRLAIFWLAALFLMHLGIFVFGSILFWKWMAIDLVFIFLLVRRKKYFEEIYATRGSFILSIVVIFLSAWWLKPISIAWHDTPYIQYFTYQVQDPQGNWHVMDKNEMNPYHQWFQYDQFEFLVHDTLPEVTGFGYTTDYELAEMLREPSPDYNRIVKEKGVVKFDTTMKMEYEEFIGEWFTNRNRNIGNELFLTAIAAPDHLHTSSCGDVYSGNFEVKAFRVILNREFSVGSHHMAMKQIIADEIRIGN